MNISDEKKVDIVLNLLNERYNASHKMRERSLNFAVWILGFGIAFAWILLNNISLPIFQKIILSIFIFIIGYLTRSFLSYIETGFNKNHEVMITLEKVLGCYEQNKYSEGISLYPEQYNKSEYAKTSHFKSIYKWLWVTILALILVIWHVQILEWIKRVFCK